MKEFHKTNFLYWFLKICQVLFFQECSLLYTWRFYLEKRFAFSRVRFVWTFASLVYLHVQWEYAPSKNIHDFSSGYHTDYKEMYSVNHFWLKCTKKPGYPGSFFPAPVCLEIMLLIFSNPRHTKWDEDQEYIFKRDFFCYDTQQGCQYSYIKEENRTTASQQIQLHNSLRQESECVWYQEYAFCQKFSSK